MDQKPLSPLQEKMENAAPQKDAEMMALIKRKGQPERPEQTPEVIKAKERLLKVMQTSGISPQTVLQAGKYAEQALSDPKMYPIAIQAAIREQLINPEDVQEGGIDYRLLASGIAAAKMVEELMQEGKL